MRVEPLRLTVDHEQGLEDAERGIRAPAAMRECGGRRGRERHPRQATAESVRGAHSPGGVR